MNYFEFMKFKKTTTTKGFYFKYMWNKLSLYHLKNIICTNQWQLSKKKNEKKNTSQVNAYLNLTEREREVFLIHLFLLISRQQLETNEQRICSLFNLT